MNQFNQLLQLHKQGAFKKNINIARILRISNMIKAYLCKLSVLEVDIDFLLFPEAPELGKQFHTGHPVYNGDRVSENSKLSLKNKDIFFLTFTGIENQQSQS